MGNGQKQLVIQAGQNYFKNGLWHKYDFSAATEASGAYTRKIENDFTVRFNPSSAQRYRIEKGVDYVEWEPQNVQAAIASMVDRKTIFQNAWNNVDLELLTTPQGLKENIILRNRNAQTSFRFKINSTLTAEASRSIVIFSNNGEPVFKVPPVFAIDAQKRFLGVQMSLTREGNDNYLTFSVDTANAVYPVVVDPTTATIQGASSTKDNSATSGSGNNNWGGWDGIRIGSFVGEAFGLLRFDLSSLPGDIYITSAYIRLNASEVTGSPGPAVLRRVKREWGEGGGANTPADTGASSWNSARRYIQNGDWDTPGALGSNDVSDSVSALKSMSTGWDSAFVTELTRDWYKGIYSNYGVKLVIQPTPGGAYRMYNSSEYGSNQPQLIVEYIPAACRPYQIVTTSVDTNLIRVAFKDSSGGSVYAKLLSYNFTVLDSTFISSTVGIAAETLSIGNLHPNMADSFYVCIVDSSTTDTLLSPLLKRYTLAARPNPPVLLPSDSSLRIILSADNNPISVKYTFYDSTRRVYLDTSGAMVSDSTHRYTRAQWDTVTYGGLSPDTLYIIKAFAYNGDTIATPGLSEASHAKAQPDKPLGLTITPTYHLALNWNPVVDNRCEYYVILKDTAAGAVDSVGGVPRGTTSFLDTNVVLGQIYFYRVQAVDSFGMKSEYSDEASMYPAITISLDSVSGRCIDSVLMPVRVDKNITKDSIYSFEIYITYDPKILESFSYDTSHSMARQLSGISLSDSNGIVRIAGFSAYPLICDTNILINLKFKIEVSQASDDHTSLDIEEVILNDDDPPTFMKSGFVQVDSLKMGDVSLNYDITAYDCSLILEHIVNISTLGTLQQWLADVSGSGSVNAYDGTLILQKVLGIIPAFPNVDSMLVLKTAGGVDNVRIKMEPYYSEDRNFVIVPFELQNAGNVKSLQFEMRYPSEKVEYDGFATSAVAKDFTTLHNVPVNGTLLVAMASARALQGDGRVVEVRFKVKDKDAPMPEFNLVKFMANETILRGDNITGIQTETGVPTVYDLGQNYPNPFNPTTTIKYQIPKQGRVSLTIYNILGQQIITLLDRKLPAGYYQIQWNGLNQRGLPVSSGIYIYQMKSGRYSHTRKLLFMK